MYKPLAIRLFKRNIKLYTSYYIVVIFKSKRNRGLFLDKLGYLNFNSKNTFALNALKLSFWLNKGAKINKTCLKYLSKFISGSIVHLNNLKKI